MFKDECIKQGNQAQIVDVLILISSLQYGGAETQSLLWAKHLKKEGLKVLLVSVLPGPLQSTLEEEAIPFYILARKPMNKLERPFIFAKSLLSLNRVINETSPSRVITFLYIESLLASILKLISKEKFALFMGRRADFGYGERGFLQNWFLRKGYKRADSVFTNSYTNLPSALKEGIVKSQVKLIDNFLRSDLIELDSFCRNEKQSKSTIRSMTVGSLSPVKNHSLAVSLVEFLGRDPNNVKLSLDIYGEGNLRNELERQIGNSNEISLLGSVTNPWLGAKRYDLYLHTSRSEGSSNALWEAAASGLPIITTPVGDFEELRKLTIGSMFISRTQEEFAASFKLVTSELHSIKEKALSNAILVREARSPERISSDITRMLKI